MNLLALLLLAYPIIAFSQEPFIVKDINPGTADGGISHPARMGDKLVFARGRDGSLWISDGSEAGTQERFVADISPSIRNQCTEWIFERLLGQVGSTYFLVVTCDAWKGYNPYPYNDGLGSELWAIDSTSQSIRLVKDIAPGTGSGLFFLNDAVVLNDALFFKAEDGMHGMELWKSDGTESGTILVKDINPDQNPPSRNRLLLNFDGSLFFWASDGSRAGLWKSDGTAGGTEIVRDLKPFLGDHYLADLEEFEDAIFMILRGNANQYELWRSDGTATGTTKIMQFPGQISQIRTVVAKTETHFYFLVSVPTGWQLWKSRGTAESTIPVKDINVSVSIANQVASVEPALLHGY